MEVEGRKPLVYLKEERNRNARNIMIWYVLLFFLCFYLPPVVEVRGCVFFHVKVSRSDFGFVSFKFGKVKTEKREGKAFCL